MPKTFTQIYNEVATAIQEKTETTAPISAENFGQRILAIRSLDNSVHLGNSGASGIFKLDKLKQYLPNEILNTNVYDCIGSQSGGMTIPVALCSYLHAASELQSSATSLFLKVEIISHDSEPSLCSSIQYNGNNLGEIISSEEPIKISDISNWESMNVSNLIDYLITQNRSASVDITWSGSSGYIFEIYPIRLGIDCWQNSDMSEDIILNETFTIDQIEEIINLSEE